MKEKMQNKKSCAGNKGLWAIVIVKKLKAL